MGGGAILEISLVVQEPSGDTVAEGVSDDFSDLGGFFFSQITSSDKNCTPLVKGARSIGSPSVDIDLCLLAENESESSSDTSDASKCEGDLSLSFEIGVKNTQNVLEFSGLFVDKRL